jgi:hypothetical protein
MQSLQAMLSRQDQVSWVQAPSNADNSAPVTHVTASLTDVTFDVGSCKLSFKDGRVFPDERYQSVQTWKLRIPEIDQIRVDSLVGFVDRFRAEGGHPSWGTKTTPAVFVLEMLAASGQKFEVHRWSKNGDSDPMERDLTQPRTFVVFAQESAAREAAKALERAKVLCTQ